MENKGMEEESKRTLKLDIECLWMGRLNTVDVARLQSDLRFSVISIKISAGV